MDNENYGVVDYNYSPRRPVRGSQASIIESIRFEYAPLRCAYIRDAHPPVPHIRFHYTIGWTGPDGAAHERGVYRCWHPLCDTSPWGCTDVFLAAWIGAIAVAYILKPATTPPVARIGICDQWEDRRYGNFRGELFSRRYYAERGPGVYPAPMNQIGKAP